MLALTAAAAAARRSSLGSSSRCRAVAGGGGSGVLVSQAAAALCGAPLLVQLVRQLANGSRFTLRRVFGQQDVDAYVQLTGDANPIHAAAATAADDSCGGTLDSSSSSQQQQQPIVPGMLLASLFPAIIGTTFPGALYVSQTLKFRAPASVGAPVVAEVTVCQSSGSRVAFDTSVRDAAAGTLLVDGTALALIRPASQQQQQQPHGS